MLKTTFITGLVSELIHQSKLLFNKIIYHPVI